MLGSVFVGVVAVVGTLVMLGLGVWATISTIHH